MNRIYIFPYVLILTFIYLYVTKPFTFLEVILALLISTIMVILFHLVTVFIQGKYLVYQHKRGKNISREKIFLKINKYLKTVNKFMRIHIRVHNLENYDPNKTYLITPNHQSNNDVTVLLDVFKQPIAYVAKAAISKLPLVKDWMALTGSVFLNRDNLREQIGVMQEVEQMLNNKESIVLFPEGTRSFKAEMNAFKPGSFKLALKTKVDILPITINNTYKVRKNFPFKTTIVDVYIHESIPYEKYKDLKTTEIAELVQNIVESKIIYD